MIRSMNKNIKRTSKFLSLLLRHQPELIGLELDSEGWASIEELIEKSKQQHSPSRLTQELIAEIVKTSDKQRFIINEKGTHIRANQGHSINVDLGLELVKPPKILFHGTATRFLQSIIESGLKKQSRQHVHLSPDKETASKVGTRHGKLVMLEIKSLEMHECGHAFYRSENGVWLTDYVPAEFIVVS